MNIGVPIHRAYLNPDSELVADLNRWAPFTNDELENLAFAPLLRTEILAELAQREDAESERRKTAP